MENDPRDPAADSPESDHASSDPTQPYDIEPREPAASGPTPDPEQRPLPTEADDHATADHTAEEHAPPEVEAYSGPIDSATADPNPESSASITAAHAVPAATSSTGESTQCPRCGTENRPGLAFCRNCGQRLVVAGMPSTVERPGAPEGTTACPRCGTHNRAGVAFCQNCGANLRGGEREYIPPAVTAAEAPREAVVTERRGALLGPVVLLIGLVGLVTGYLLPFRFAANDSLAERAVGANGYGIAFWSGYPDVGGSLADQVYFGLAAPLPLLAIVLVALAIAGFRRAVPGPLQVIGLVVALLWSVGLIALFGVVEFAGSWDGDLVGMLRNLTAGGIIFLLASLIVVIGALTRFGRS